jgi:hypothetical protein
MSGVVLRDYDSYDRFWLLDPGSGRCVRTPAGVSHGFLHAEPAGGPAGLPGISAVYADSSTLWFQADAQRWDVRDLELSYDFNLDGQVSLLAIAGDVVVIDASYQGPLADPLNQADPALDALDVEGQDFFYYLFLRKKEPDWQTGAVSFWGEGFRPVRH